MPANEIGEKIYFGDATSKVTNVRVTCNHITVPVEKIESVNVNFRIEMFSLSVLLLLLSFSPLLFSDFIPEEYDVPFLFFTIIVIASAFSWLVMVFRNYTELIVAVGGRRLAILSENMLKKDYICKVADAIGNAISDEKEYQNMKKTGEISQSTTPFNSSETVRLKLMLEDYEKLTAKKEDFPKAKNG
jgi:hypothetical protein